MSSLTVTRMYNKYGQVVKILKRNNNLVPVCGCHENVEPMSYFLHGRPSLQSLLIFLLLLIQVFQITSLELFYSETEYVTHYYNKPVPLENMYTITSLHC